MALSCTGLRPTDVNRAQMSSKIEHLCVNSEVRYKCSFISFQRITPTCRYHCMTGLGHSQTGRFSAVDRSSRHRPLPAVLPDPLPAMDGEQHCEKSHCSPLPRAPLRSPPRCSPRRGAGHALRLETFGCRWRDVESLHRDRVGCPAGPATYSMDGDEMTTAPPTDRETGSAHDR